MSDFWGLVLSKPTKDIKTVTSLKDIDFSSDYIVPKILMSGEDIINVTVSGIEGTASAQVTINHALGYIPRVFLQVSLENSFSLNDITYYVKAPYGLSSSGAYFYDSVTYEITDQNLIINVDGVGWVDPARMGYVYYLFYDEL